MKIFKHLIVGLGIGFFCTIFFMLLFTGLNVITAQILAWFLASAVYGISSMIFDSSRLSVALKCFIHFALSLSVTIAIAIIFYKSYVATVFVSFIITYIIIFFIMQLIEKHNIKEINDKLKNV